MTDARHRPWIRLDPPLTSKASQQAFVDHARALARVRPGARGEDLLKEVRAAFVAASDESDRGKIAAAYVALLDGHPRDITEVAERLAKEPTFFSKLLAADAFVAMQQWDRANAILESQKFLGDSVTYQRRVAFVRGKRAR